MGIDFSPLAEAVARMKRKTPVARALSSQEWSEVPRELRERAFWTANFAKADVLQLMHEKLTAALELGREQVKNGKRFVNRETFIESARTALNASGYRAPEGKEGTLQDHYTKGRLGMIYDINTQMAQEYGRWKVGQDPDVLDAFPCQELIRVQSRKVPRKWHSRWAARGGREFRGRMIARKNDPIWTAISAFHNPWPPFDYNSGMGIREVGRRDAETLGVIRPGEKITPAHKGFNDTLSLSCSNLTPELQDRLKAQFGDQVVIKDGRASWRYNLIEDFVEQALKNLQFKESVSFGVATPQTVEKARAFRDLTDYQLLLTADEARHVIKTHGVGNERDKKQVGLTAADIADVIYLWHAPDEVTLGNQEKVPDSLKFKKNLNGLLTMVTWRISEKKKLIRLHSLYKKKVKGEPHE